MLHELNGFIQISHSVENYLLPLQIILVPHHSYPGLLWHGKPCLTACEIYPFWYYIMWGKYWPLGPYQQVCSSYSLVLKMPNVVLRWWSLMVFLMQISFKFWSSLTSIRHLILVPKSSQHAGNRKLWTILCISQCAWCILFMLCSWGHQWI